MGQQLEKPVTAKESACGAADGGLGIAWASSCMQGWRIGMEDAHITQPFLRVDGAQGGIVSAALTAGWRGIGLFGVFDGHGGEHVAKFVERHLAEELCSFPVGFGPQGRNERDVSAALRETFHRMDELLFDKKSLPELCSLANRPVQGDSMERLARESRVDPDNIGCTACVCCVTERHFIVANAGDSRAVLCRDGKAVPLSFDHKPNHPEERRRIEASGGTVEPSGPGQFRVNGNLNLSRALGDLTYKRQRGLRPEQQTICATPDVMVEERTARDEFVVICCDGVWDMMENQEVVDFVLERVPTLRSRAQGGGAASARVGPTPQRLEQVMEQLLDACLSPDLRKTGGYGGDNMTAVIFRLTEALPHHATVDTDAGGESGVIRVQVAMPDACQGIGDTLVRVSEATASIHVGSRASGVAEGPEAGFVTRLIRLGDHLPEGAVLAPATSDSAPDRAAPAARSATFDAARRELQVTLPWRR